MMLDSTPFVFDRIQYQERALCIVPPLVLIPRGVWIDGVSCMTVEQPELNLFTWATTRQTLEDEIIQHLFFLWDEYVLENEDVLSPDAKKLRLALMARIQEE